MIYSAYNIVQRLADTSERIFPWIRHMVEAWGRNAKSLWVQPNVVGKILAVAWVGGGVIIMSYCAYFLLIMIPILLLIAFIAAVWSSVGGRTRL